jgi:glycosyltransferase involved in cell wall biosynthesis
MEASRPLKIGIYADTGKETHLRGVGFHIVNLLRELSRLDQRNRYYLYYQRSPLHGDPAPAHFPATDNFHHRPIKFPQTWINNHPRLWWDYWLPLQIKRDCLDVFHGPNHFLPLLRGSTAVMTIHDIAYFHLDHLYQPEMTNALRVWTAKSLQRATRVIALSQNTAADLEKLGVERDRMRVVYGGGNIIPDEQIQLDKADEVRRKYRLPDHYILYVGTLHPRKNVPFLLRAFAELKRIGSLPHQLVLVGLRGTGAADVLQNIDDLSLNSDVVITGYVADWEVPLLYQMADVFVLPTLYEGFTLVTLEAMHYGVPVISTDTSSIREGVGDAGVLVGVDDVPALVQALTKVLSDEPYRAELIRRGKIQSQKFTWQECARQTLAVYHEAAGTFSKNGTSQ